MKVVKPFNTLNRRFKVGDDVGPEDVVGDKTFEQWQETGHISREALEAAPAPTEHVAPDDHE